LSEYDDPEVNREDKTMNLGAGLSWSPLKWLKFDLSYAYIDFQTDSSQRGDYTENKATFSLTLITSKKSFINTSSSSQ
jgi:opacity protein-like surface antigen